MLLNRLVFFKGGVAHNIIPAVYEADFDIRVTPNIDLEEFKKKLENWIHEAENGEPGTVTYEYFFQVNTKTFFKITRQWCCKHVL